MRLKLRDPALTLVIGLALGLPASLAWGAPTAQGADTLLQAARMWDGKQRGDLARQMLEKYLLARPDSAEALLMLGELELRSGQPARAEALLQRLRQHHPQARETRDLALLLRLQTRDGEALAQMRLLARAASTKPPWPNCAASSRTARPPATWPWSTTGFWPRPRKARPKPARGSKACASATPGTSATNWP